MTRLDHPLALDEPRASAPSASADTFWRNLEPQAPDALLAIIRHYREDSRPGKIDLGVGIYRDEQGRTPVMAAAKAAEGLLWQTQPTKAYLGAEGDVVYTALLAQLALGESLARSDRLVGVQTPGGTGALRLGAELLARASPGATVWTSEPTWPNHGPIFTQAGLRMRTHRYYRAGDREVDVHGMLADLAHARPGDVILLQASCHNPTGATLGPADWRQIAGLCERKGLTPFLDLAYQGLGDGLEEDAAATRLLLNELPDALVAYSCDKNFGLYRDRVGALWVQSESSERSDAVYSNMLALARSLWSMPPDHGAAVVRTVLEADDLRAKWSAELDTMRGRINALREALGASHPALAPLARQRGMFALLPLAPAQIAALRAERGVYMAGNGRINLCGLTLATVPDLLDALRHYLPEDLGA
ncbi:aromatic-amino-acid transaminase [Novosphingobium chloroacetimidivorans]|uniref:Aromatic-amino-acid transaminase n=1 Tax=Novosphingobium chloroacetimidivorans TaxID=1428314 RepID=A0A7W7NWC8_9SPHN|nr:amino acid aminotransferase [Novosphingobium chloroacetimidivorans]MBB4857977.1 aromatic-amino-acid transaminase [Novosphingobium chloroacetimidivorans]